MQTKDRQKMLLIIAAVGLGLLLVDNLLISPLYASWTTRNKQIAALRQRLDQGRRLVNGRTSIVGRWDRIRTNSLPSDVSLAEGEMLKAVNRWAQDSGAKLESIKPQWRDSGDDYMTLECRADAIGDMPTLTRFLYELEKDPMSLKVENIELSSRDNDGQQLTLGLQISGLLLTAQQP